MTTILVVTGDHLINSSVGLVTPTTNLDDGGTYRSSKGQKWLWRKWLEFWGDIEKVKRKNKAKVVSNQCNFGD